MSESSSSLRQRSRPPSEYPCSDPLTTRLPLEICATIFDYALPSVDIVSEAHQYNPMSGRRNTPRHMSSLPLILSQVCQAWRAICHSTPHLWTVLTVYLGGKADAVMNGVLEDTLEWIWAARAGISLPLKIILCESYINIPAAPTSLHSRSVFNLIATYAPRICYLQATISKPGLAELCRLYRDRSALKTLQVFVADRRRVPLDDGPPFRPSMLCTTRIGWKHVVIDISLLTHVEVTDLFFQEWMDLISSSPRLVSYTLHNPRHFAASPPPVPWPGGYDCTPITYPNLKSLSILNVTNQFVIAQILDKFTLPALELLALQPTRKSQQDVFSSTLEHLRRSHASLRTLTINSLRLHTAGDCTRLAELLALVSPTLQSLTLAFPMLGSEGHLRDITHQDRLIDLFVGALRRLRCLRELTVASRTYNDQSGQREWLFLLRTLLKSNLSSALVTSSNSNDVLSITLRSSISPLVGLRTISELPDPKLFLTAPDVQDMLDAIQHPQLHLKIKCAAASSSEYEDALWSAHDDIDVSTEVIAAFRSLVKT